MQITKILLDDDGFQIVGNAILLGYLIESLNSRGRGDEASVLEERMNYSERTTLRDLLESSGALDKRIRGSRGNVPSLNPRSIDDFFAEIIDLANSDADIARLRLKDIDFGSEDVKAEILSGATPYELRTEIAALGPTSVIRKLSEMVLNYYRHSTVFSKCEPSKFEPSLTQHPIAMLPMTKSGVRSNRKSVRYAGPLEKALQLMKDGECERQPYTASRLVVEQDGWIPDDKWTKGCGKVPALSEESAIDTLGRKLSKLMKGIDFDAN